MGTSDLRPQKVRVANDPDERFAAIHPLTRAALSASGLFSDQSKSRARTKPRRDNRDPTECLSYRFFASARFYTTKTLAVQKRAGGSPRPDRCRPLPRCCSGKRSAAWRRLCSHCDHKRLNAHNVDDAREIVGEHVQRHLGGDLRQTLRSARQPHHLNIASSLSFQSAARLNPIEITVNVELQQPRGMISRSASCLGSDPVKPQLG